MSSDWYYLSPQDQPYITADMTPSIATIRSSDNPAAAALPKLMDRWLLLGAYGPRARFHMVAAWTALAGLAAVDAVWLSLSRLSFAASNWDSIIRLVLFTAIAFGFCGLVSHRLANETDRVGSALREGAKRVELFAVAALAFALLAVTVIAYCCLGTAAALPLQDARLAQIDRWMGFDWAAFVEFANSSALASWLLVKAYQSTPYMLIGTMLWCCISGQGERLAEFLALSCITSVGIAIGMMILPAAGAYPYYHLPFSAYEHFGAGSGMWHHELLMALRTGQTTVIDFNVPNSNCLVTFPSGHTILAIITTYALRGSRWTLIPALIVNGAMVVSTIPHGGHHLFDLVVGGVIAACAIFFVRLPVSVRRSGLAASGDVGLASA
jgi:membrane-associated phospholipid phosphatase